MITYSILSNEELRKVSPDSFSRYMEDDYGYNLVKFEDEKFHSIIYADGGEPEDQTLVRDVAQLAEELMFVSDKYNELLEKQQY